ncbi:hypothetical protein FRB99_001560 [Tulasnella sp. 403]|nr:hypothetical protein FRB99_001560 [Tulasnella sp. 403]
MSVPDQDQPHLKQSHPGDEHQSTPSWTLLPVQLSQLNHSIDHLFDIVRSPPSIPHALEIPELLHLICQNLPTSDAMALMLVSHAFHEVAADRVWRVLRDVTPLLHLWSTITGPPTRKDWISSLPLSNLFHPSTLPDDRRKRFDFYAKRVKVIEFSSFCYEFYDQGELDKALGIPLNPVILCPSLTSITVRFHLWHAQLFSRFCPEQLVHVYLTLTAGREHRKCSDEEMYEWSVLVARTLSRMEILETLVLDWADCPFKCAVDCSLLAGVVTGKQRLRRVTLPQQPECICTLKALGQLPRLSVLRVLNWCLSSTELQNSIPPGSFPALQHIEAPIDVTSSILSLPHLWELSAITCYVPLPADPLPSTPALLAHASDPLSQPREPILAILSYSASYAISSLEIVTDQSLNNTPYVNLLSALVNMETFCLHSPTALSNDVLLRLVPKWPRLRKFEWRSLSEPSTASVCALSAFSNSGGIVALSIPLDTTCEGNNDVDYDAIRPLLHLRRLDVSAWKLCANRCMWIVQVLRRLLPLEEVERVQVLGIGGLHHHWWMHILGLIQLLVIELSDPDRSEEDDSDRADEEGDDDEDDDNDGGDDNDDEIDSLEGSVFDDM